MNAAKRKTTAMFSSQLNAQLIAAVKGSRLGPRGKSQWVSEAVELLFETDPGLELVGVGEALGRKGSRVGIYLDHRAQELIEKGAFMLRRQDPAFLGPASAILRAAVKKRLATEVPAGDFSEKET